MFSYQLLAHPDSFTLSESRIMEIFQCIAEAVDIPQKGIINIAFLSDDEIQAFNLAYRWIDKTTDVLSFHYFDDFSDISDDDIAGEIIMSESRIVAQAIEHMHSDDTEFQTLLIHGILHILGYDHEEDDDFAEMWQIEKPIRDKFNLT